MRFLRICIVPVAFCSLLALPPACPAAEPTPLEAAQPIVGTATFGHTYPGATVPFGMVQLSPDTGLTGWEHCSGYHYEDKAILGFSHNHLSGTGCPDLGDIRITPLGPTAPPQNKEGYLCPFSHKDEVARPGYYSVVLQNPKVKVELTATAHAGFHKYSFSGGQPVSLNFDLVRGIANDPAGDTLEGVVAVKNNVLSGYRRSKGWAADKTCYFVAEFSRPFDTVGITADDKPFDFGSRTSPAAIPSRRKFEGSEEMAVKGVRVTAGVGFNESTRADPGESRHFRRERRGRPQEPGRRDPGLGFPGDSRRCRGELERHAGPRRDRGHRPGHAPGLLHGPLSRRHGPHALQRRRRQLSRPGPQGPQGPEGFQNYCTFSLWDTFRAEHALLTIVQPQRVDDFIGTMLAHYRQFGQHALPVWSLAGNETWCMIGNHAVPVITEAYAKGFRRYDVEAVYQAARDALMQDRNFMAEYRAKGYVPSSNDTTTPRGEQNQSVSRTLEYAYDDWCLGRMAQLLGKTDDAKLFLARSRELP